MHLCGHSSIKFLWSCDARAHDSFSLFKSTQMFPKYVLLSIDAFIRVYFERSGKFSQHSLFRCITHIFFQKLVMISEFFSKKSWKLSLFKSRLGFLARQLIFLFPFFSFLFFFFSSSFFFFLIYHLFISFCVLFLSEKVVRIRVYSVSNLFLF